MRIVAFLMLLAAAAVAFVVTPAAAAFVTPAKAGAQFPQAGTQSPKTVCTITVNSPDEKATLAARLPKGEYRFVELVEKGRGDWLRSAAQGNVRCDVLVVSGHFNAGETFYSDKVGVDEHLQVDEVERAACSESFPGLFANLKEVYLFGCESLNPDATKYSSAYGESGRERMRRIFAHVPSIYGFYSSAPVGPTAAMLLNRYFDGGNGAFGSGQPNERLLKVFGRNHMTRVAGVREGEPQFAQRREICQFFDERLDASRKLAFIHSLMRRDMAEARRYFRRIEKVLATLPDAERASPRVQQALAAIAVDGAARDRFVAFLHGAEPGERARLIDLGTALGWLDANRRQDEQLALMGDLLRQPRLGHVEVDLACAANADHGLDGSAASLQGARDRAPDAGHAAVLACLGSKPARTRVLQALASSDERDVQVAQAYLRLRPDIAKEDLRSVTREIARMPSSPAQVRALESVARLNITDPDVLAEIAAIYANARSANVQRAAAEVFIRAGADVVDDKPELVSTLREHRVKAGDSHGDLVDVLIQRLES